MLKVSSRKFDDVSNYSIISNKFRPSKVMSPELGWLFTFEITPKQNFDPKQAPLAAVTFNFPFERIELVSPL